MNNPVDKTGLTGSRLARFLPAMNWVRASTSPAGFAATSTPESRLPPAFCPLLQWRDLNELLPLAMAWFPLGAVETAA